MTPSPTQSATESASTPRPSPIVKLFLIALPVGLAFMVPISLVIYYERKNAKQEATAEFAAMLRRELNAEDMAKYITSFVQTIGDRSPTQPDNVAAASAYVESTMGMANMGYNVQRLPFDTGRLELYNLVAELPGKRKAGETVLVVADYDAEDARGISALMCLAHSVVATTHARTIRFAAILQGESPTAQSNGLLRLAESLADAGVKVTTILYLRPPPATVPPAWEKARAIPLLQELDTHASTVLARLQRLKATIEQAADGD